MSNNSREDSIYDYILNKLVIPEIGHNTTFQSDLDRYGKQVFGRRFHGVYPSDKIPKLTKKTPYAILNLDGSDEGGSHWVAVAKSGKDIILYDSFGRHGSKILPTLHKSGNGRIVNTELDAEQADEELNCGARSFAWLLMINAFGKGMALKI